MEKSSRIPIKAMIYHVADGRTVVKAYANVMFGKHLSINSFSIAMSSINNDMVVYPPSTRCGGNKYKRIVEFPDYQNSRLKDQIDKVCLLAYAQYEDDGELRRYTEPVYVGIEELVGSSKTNAQNLREYSENSIPDKKFNFPY